MTKKGLYSCLLFLNTTSSLTRGSSSPVALNLCLGYWLLSLDKLDPCKDVWVGLADKFFSFWNATLQHCCWFWVGVGWWAGWLRSYLPPGSMETFYHSIGTTSINSLNGLSGSGLSEVWWVIMVPSNNNTASLWCGSCWATSLVVLASPKSLTVRTISYLGVDIPFKMKVLSSSVGFDELSHCSNTELSVHCAQNC